MAFSQKHSGKVFVPWFNTAEWRGVYDSLTSNLDEEIKNALKILKIWKQRTPLLSGGVEGTLILLEALVTDYTNVPDSQIIQIYSIALLRFLNICATNSDKQGTFKRTAQKNDLPKWLIDIRHEIAHSHTLPSKSILELSLTYSLQWLLQKYWKVQNETICDYYTNTDNSNSKILDTLNVYIRLIINLYNDVDMDKYDEALMAKINYLVSKRYNKTRTDSRGLILILEEILKQALSEPINKNQAIKIAELVVDSKAILATNLEINEDGKEIIPKSFMNIWTNLFNILYEKGLLEEVLNKLFLVATNKTNNDTVSKVAVLWMHGILDGLFKIQYIEKELQSVNNGKNDNLDSRTTRIILITVLEKNDRVVRECINFSSAEGVHLTNLNNIEDAIIENPSVESIKLLEKIMVWNDKPEEYKNVVIKIAKTICGLDTPSAVMRSSLISTVDDIPVHVNVLADSNNSSDMFSSNVDSQEVMSEEPDTNCRWSVIKDTSIFKDCPLGVLPHQRGQKIPF